ncbi:hypothetical protein B0H14DRAFT_3629086 [Mycena olivaceomarginata]|nr:hypothetical protein B0H14DRAFT_3629086 [Mycena olivaceomarginata]
MPDMVNSYICYCTEQATAGGPLCMLLNEEDLTVQEVYEIQVVDIFKTFTTDMKLKPTETSIAPTLVREGLLPCTPWAPSVVITTRMLETYRIQHVCYPQLAIQSFVKSLCNMHGVTYHPYLCQQFSITYNLYLDICHCTDEHVMLLLGHDSKWWMKHACPTCMYKLEGEDKLIFDMLTTMDGGVYCWERPPMRRTVMPMAARSKLDIYTCDYTT